MVSFNKYVGIPFKEKGQDWDGCDCWGLVRLFYRTEYGVILTDLTTYYKDTSDKINIGQAAEIEKHNARLTDSPKEGDVILFRFFGYPMHVGIYINDQKMLHVMKGIDAIIERHDKSPWKHRKLGVYVYDVH